MKLVTIDCREIGGRPGVILPGDEILDLAAAPTTLDQSQWIPYSVVSVLAAGQEGFDRASLMINQIQRKTPAEREALRQDGVLLPYKGTALLPPIRRPGLVLVVDESSRSYMKSPNTSVPNGAQVELPRAEESAMESAAMIAAVMGRPLYQGTAENAAASVAGYMLLADLSARFSGDFQTYVESKQFPGANPMGPAILTKDEIGDLREIELRLSLNDVGVGSAPAYEFSQSIADRLAGLSQRYSFRPGDLVCFEPRAASGVRGHRVHPGDSVKIELGDVMSLVFSIVKD